MVVCLGEDIADARGPQAGRKHKDSREEGTDTTSKKGSGRFGRGERSESLETINIQQPNNHARGAVRLACLSHTDFFIVDP